MLRKICINGSIFLPLLFVVGTISLRDYVSDTIGHLESILLLFLFLLFISILVFFHYSKVYLKYTLGLFFIFTGLASIVLYHSSSTKQRLEKAYENSVKYSMIDLATLPDDEKKEVRSKYVKIETEATELELKAANLRFAGPDEYYGDNLYLSISFYAFSSCLIILGFCWILYESKNLKLLH